MDDHLSDLTIGGNDCAASAPNLQKNLGILSPDEVQPAKILLSEGQEHLFAHRPEPGVDDQKKQSFFEQVSRLNACYPGGLVSYIKNARKLLADSKAGKNPFDGFTPLLALPSEPMTGTRFLQHYIESILALQDASCSLSQDSSSVIRLQTTMQVHLRRKFHW